MQLVALNGFQSNPDTPGCERVVGTWMQDSWLEVPQIDIEAQAIGVGAATAKPSKRVYGQRVEPLSLCPWSLVGGIQLSGVFPGRVVCTFIQ